MDETLQMNLRISKELLYELEFIANYYHINKSEWLKTKLAEIILREHRHIMATIEEDYLKGRIGVEDFKDMTGLKPSPQLQKRLADELTGKESAKHYLQEIQKKLQKSKDNPLPNIKEWKMRPRK